MSMLQESQPPLPAEASPGALPPLPPDEDLPPLPPDEAAEARLASAGLFEPVSHAAAQLQPPPLPSPATGVFAVNSQPLYRLLHYLAPY